MRGSTITQGEGRTTRPSERLVRLADEDPDLFAGLDAGALRRLAPFTVARAVDLPPGGWDERMEEQSRAPLGLLLLRGLLLREGTLGREHCVEILGPGDPIRPWVETGSTALSVEARW